MFPTTLRASLILHIIPLLSQCSQDREDKAEKMNESSIYKLLRIRTGKYGEVAVGSDQFLSKSTDRRRWQPVTRVRSMKEWPEVTGDSGCVTITVHLCHICHHSRSQAAPAPHNVTSTVVARHMGKKD